MVFIILCEREGSLLTGWVVLFAGFFRPRPLSLCQEKPAPGH